MLAITNNKKTMTGASFLALLFTALLLLAGCAPGSEETPPLPASATVVQDQAQTLEVEEALEEQKDVESLEEEQQEKASQEQHEQQQKEQQEEQQIPERGDVEEEPSPPVTPVTTMAESTTNPPTAQVTIRSMEGLPDIITDQPVAWEPGDTVLNLLIRVTREHRVHLAYRGRGRTAYVEGINNLYEFDHGPASGWVYSVNGVFPDRSAGGWETAADDNIIWWYTLDAGRDVGVSSQ